MATRALVKEEFIGADQLNSKDIRCPHCHGNTLVLYGNSQIQRIESLVNGEVESCQTDPNTHCFELEMMDCLACDIRFRIKTREVMELEKRNEELRQMVIEATGNDPFGMGRPC